MLVWGSLRPAPIKCTGTWVGHIDHCWTMAARRQDLLVKEAHPGWHYAGALWPPWRTAWSLNTGDVAGRDLADHWSHMMHIVCHKATVWISRTHLHVFVMNRLLCYITDKTTWLKWPWVQVTTVLGFIEQQCSMIKPSYVSICWWLSGSEQ